MSREENKRYLAVDYGSRRIGLAKSDPMGIIASALETLEVRSVNEALEKLLYVIQELEPSAIVIGYPLLSSGDKSEKCFEIDKFIDKFSKLCDLPVYKVDESYSSIEAAAVLHAHGKKTGQDKKRVDRLAAVIILQRFIDEKSNG